MQSPAAATMFAPPGRIRLVALCVMVGVLSKIQESTEPAGITPKEVIGPVEPVIWTSYPVAVERSTVAADAISADFTFCLIHKGRASTMTPEVITARGI